jgi:hypothetical protein
MIIFLKLLSEMSKYKQSKIYIITCEKDIYIGSTTISLHLRYLSHRTQKTCSMYKYIHNNYNGDWSEWKISLYEDYPCNSKQELRKKEGEIIKTFLNNNKYNVINKVIAGRTNQEWIRDNREQYDIWMKNYNINRKEERKERDKINNAKINETRRIYLKNNPPKYLKIECDCGMIMNRKCLSRHIKRKNHQDLMDKQTSAILLFLKSI